MKHQHVYRSEPAYGPAAQAVQTQLVGEFTDAHRVGKILFVGEHQKNGVLQLVFLDLQRQSWREGLRHVTDDIIFL